MKLLLIKLSKVLLKLALDEGLKRGLPLIYKRLDAQMPLLIANNASPQQVQGAIASAISSVTNHRVTQSQLQAIIGLYDPIAAARNMLASRR